MTGQFGKNHQGDRGEHLPTKHGFDEFIGSLYHLNAEEEPENRDYPRDMKLANGKTFLEPIDLPNASAHPGAEPSPKLHAHAPALATAHL
jgi:arylsulfatase A-like enzyme